MLPYAISVDNVSWSVMLAGMEIFHIQPSTHGHTLVIDLVNECEILLSIDVEHAVYRAIEILIQGMLEMGLLPLSDDDVGLAQGDDELPF